MTATEASRQLGKCDNFLNVFRSQNNIPKGTNALVLKKMYEERLRKFFNTRERLQEIYYELEELKHKQYVKNMASFGFELKRRNIITNHNSVYSIFEKAFSNYDFLIGNRFTKRYEEIIKAYEEWKCQ